MKSTLCVSSLLMVFAAAGSPALAATESRPLAHPVRAVERSSSSTIVRGVAAIEVYQALGADDPVLTLVRQRLGWALLEQQRHAEAEPVLLTAYEAYQRFEARASLSATQKSWKWQTAELLARLYEEMQQPAKAAEWKKKTTPATPPPALPGNP
jgi:hypothetical protein